MDTKYQFTQQGYDDLKKELDHLISRRPQVVINLSAAREMGDLSENAGYHAAKDELSQIDSRVKTLKYILRVATIAKNQKTETVTFGCTVKVSDGKDERVFVIVNALEADPLKGKMSGDSPIGSALIGKRVGDAVDIDIPNGKVNYKILEIS